MCAKGALAAQTKIKYSPQTKQPLWQWMSYMFPRTKKKKEPIFPKKVKDQDSRELILQTALEFICYNLRQVITQL